jgi:hypothetical protein
MEIQERKTFEDFPKFVVTSVHRGATSEAGYTWFELEGRFDPILGDIFNRIGDTTVQWFWLMFGKRG